MEESPSLVVGSHDGCLMDLFMHPFLVKAPSLPPSQLKVLVFDRAETIFLEKLICSYFDLYTVLKLWFTYGI
jgi:hypothetical protein